MSIPEVIDIYKIKNDEEADYVINNLKKDLQFYKDKNLQYDAVLSKLKLTPDSLSFSSRETLDKFSKLQDAAGVNKLDVLDIQLSFLEHVSATYDYRNKSNTLKGHLENLRELIGDTAEQTETIEREISAAKTLVENIAPKNENELEELNLQVESYEKKLLEFIDKYPWLNEPEYNLLSIQEEIKKVYRLQEELKGLKKEVDNYCGLSSDIFTAKNQLSKIKTEYENMSKQ